MANGPWVCPCLCLSYMQPRHLTRRYPSGMALSLVALFEKFPHELAAVKWFEDQRCGR